MTKRKSAPTHWTDISITVNGLDVIGAYSVDRTDWMTVRMTGGGAKEARGGPAAEGRADDFGRVVCRSQPSKEVGKQQMSRTGITNLAVDAVRKQTRLALPDDDAYLYRIGVALYGFASLCSFMAEVACHLDKTLSRSEVEAGTGGAILSKFRASAKTVISSLPQVEPIAQNVVDMFSALNKERTDFVHAYPITNDTKAQILHRRKDAEDKYFEVTNEFLERFITRLDTVSDKLYEIRSIVSA
ncbi:hypothetical protein [Caballeronia sp. dw_276]|uniref:hypothetical protein n=1 Tax=Caballeronia sp. dw_276 TaxID=2719795 RepID=UPI001BD2DC6E|nr:hypothetical protein [Caballeronia sp. dw_276]